MTVTSITKNLPEKEHEVLDYAKCVEIYKPLRRKIRGEIVNSPFHVFSVETLRTAFDFEKENWSSQAVDLFVWSKGEPQKPYLTKLGGLPFLPEDRPWPLDRSGKKGNPGKPCVFIGQISFVDSKDIFPVNLPGDVLLIFSDEDYCDDDPRYGKTWAPCYQDVFFEWVNVPGTVPWSAEAIQEREYRSFVTPLYGVIHRSHDYLETENSLADIDDLEKKIKKEFRSKPDRSYLIPAFSGTKIGGFPHYIQSGPDMGHSYWDGATYIGQLTSVQFETGSPFPWCNWDASQDDIEEFDPLMMGDIGDLYLFLNPQGEVIWKHECY